MGMIQRYRQNSYKGLDSIQPTTSDLGSHSGAYDHLSSTTNIVGDVLNPVWFKTSELESGSPGFPEALHKILLTHLSFFLQEKYVVS